MNFSLENNVHHISFNQIENSYLEETVSVIPDVMTELVLSFGEPYARRNLNEKQNRLIKTSHFIGLKTKRSELILNSNVKDISIRFLPGAIANFTNLNMNDLSNLVVDADLIFGKAIFDLESRLFESKNDRESKSIIEAFLREKFCPRPKSKLISNCLDEFYKTPTTRSLSDFISFNSDYKKLERAFKFDVGITPKKLQQLVNFNFSTKLLSGNCKLNLSQIAYDAGYSDQAHFNNKFKKISGYTPTEYFNLKNCLLQANQQAINKMF